MEEIYTFSRSCECLLGLRLMFGENVRHSEANRRWENQVKEIRQSNSYRELSATHLKENGIPSPHKMMERFKETNHPVFKSISALSRGILKRKNNRDTIHFNADASNSPWMDRRILPILGLPHDDRHLFYRTLTPEAPVREHHHVGMQR